MGNYTLDIQQILGIGYEDIKEGRYYQRDREGLLN